MSELISMCVQEEERLTAKQPDGAHVVITGPSKGKRKEKKFDKVWKSVSYDELQPSPGSIGSELQLKLELLITAKSPVGLTHRVKKAVKRGSFVEIPDQTVPDWPIEEALLIKMALKCAELRRKDGPDLGKVVMPELERLRALAEEYMSRSENLSYPRTAPSDYSCRSRSSTGT
ncbi:hypothetical protein RJ639_014342 [Escallonia herrerae]|uniref:RING-type E3 ubiquitin transferase n=1 Tax=Escallonia herrerae TaxID=1293975 RepID=A0AA88VFR4_9ASTE|nr:hypothetical protein RJ639_014342 [Escallonia herrerae]